MISLLSTIWNVFISIAELLSGIDIYKSIRRRLKDPALRKDAINDLKLVAMFVGCPLLGFIGYMLVSGLF